MKIETMHEKLIYREEFPRGAWTVCIFKGRLGRNEGGYPLLVQLQWHHAEMFYVGNNVTLGNLRNTI